MRMAGADYVAIARAGGGILSSHRAIESIAEDELAAQLEARLRRMAALGVTTVEVKSGYGLEPEVELKQLRAIARASARGDLPRVVPTFLALHALPPNETDRDRYAAAACALVREVAARKLARFVDAYVDENAFTVDEARASAKPLATLASASASTSGSSRTSAARSSRGARREARRPPRARQRRGRARPRSGERRRGAPSDGGFTLGQAPPTVAMLRAAGVSLVVASDANPGTAPTESLPLAMALAVRSFGLTPDETLVAATLNAARSLDVDAGVLRVGAPADLVLWDLPHELALVQPWGTPRAKLVLRDGNVIARA